jgi:hypothetical protein
MPPVAADGRAVTDAVAALLTAAGLTVGRGQAPPGNPPYVLLWGGWGAPGEGTAAAPSADGSWVRQITSVGIGPEQAEWLNDRVLTALLGATPPLGSGRALMCPIQLDSSGDVQRDDTTAGAPLWYVPTRVRIDTTPA